MPTTTETIFQRAMAEYLRTGAIAGFSGGDGENDPPANDPPADDPPSNDPPDLGDKGQAALKAERDARKAAEKRLKELEREKADREAKEREAAEAKAKEDGKFKELLDSRTTELDQLKATHESVTGELDALRSYFDADYKAALKELPEAITALAPEATEPFTVRSAWLTKAREAAKKIGTTTPRGNGPNPPPGGHVVNGKDVIAQTRARARL